MARADQAAVPPRPVPPPLRPLLRFTRLHATALATVCRVLDEDDAFRAHVCAAVDLGALAEGGAAAALFLSRPEGWEPEVAALVAAAEEEAANVGAERADAAAVRRLEAVEAALARGEAEIRLLRDDVARWRTTAEAERRARRTAETDAGRLRKRVAELEREASGSAADRAGGAPAWRAAVDAAEARAARAEAAAVAARADAAEARAALVAASATSPGPAPAERAVDHGAVAQAVGAAVDAVGSLAEALGAAARALGQGTGDLPSTPEAGPAGSEGGRPARSQRRWPARAPEPLPPAVFDDEVAAAEHLLRVPNVLVLVDGYNVTITARGGVPLPEQRRWLLDAATGAAARTGAEFVVVFDGDAAGSVPADRSRRRGVQVRFTSADVEADDAVLDLLADLPPDRPAVVVSDDRRVRGGARRLGANVVGVDQLVGALRC